MIFGQGKETPIADATAEADASEPFVKGVTALGIPIENLSIQIKGGMGTVSGTSKSQADRGKVLLAVGNTKGIAQVDDQITAEKPEAEAAFYIDSPRGDTLSKIAREQYHDASKYPVIFEANRPVLKDPGNIYPGQKLRIPLL
jgi:nucleoid-associated protein YgaU